jgi:APA family basic amino acid/polyamine antiporter
MQGQLKRSLSLGGSIAMVVGIVIGASIFVLIPALAGMTGPSLFIAYAVSVVPVIFASLYLVQLGGALPVTGANYIVVTRLISPGVGVIMSLGAVITMVSTICLVAWGFAQYVAAYIPGISLVWCAIGVVLFFGFINCIGVKTVEWVQVAMFLLLLTGMFLFAIPGLFNIHAGNLVPLFPNGIGQFITVIAVASFSWGGVVVITEVAGEVKDPKRNIPLAIIFSILIIFLLYVGQTFVFVGTAPWAESAKIGTTAVLVNARTFLPEWTVAVIALGALFAMTTTINALIMLSAREILAWSRDRVLPAFFSRIDKRYNTPIVNIIVTTLLSVAGVAFAAALEKYALMVVFALMVIQIFGSIATWRIPGKMPELYKKALFRFGPFWRHFTMISCVFVSVLLFAFGWLADYRTGIVFTAIMAMGVAYWLIRAAYLKAHGTDLRVSLRKMGEDTLREIESA